MTVQAIVGCEGPMAETAGMGSAVSSGNRVFWCRHMAMRSFCSMIGRNGFGRCRAGADCKDVGFEGFGLWWAGWFEIAGDTSLARGERRHPLLYVVHALSGWFPCEHGKQVIDDHVRLALLA